MSTTQTSVDLKLGINLSIGSVPVSLAAEVDYGPDGTTYTFNGCVTNAEIDIGNFLSYVGQQFGVTVQLPPELDLKAEIDYVAGQVIYTQPKTGSGTTELGVAAKFDLITSSGKSFTFTFYADTILATGKPNAYVVGGSIDFDLPFSSLPLVGSIPVVNEYVLKHLGFSYTNTDPKDNGGKPVQFHIPKVNKSSNPLFTRSSTDAKDKNIYTVDSSGDQTNFSIDSSGFAFTAGLMRQGSSEAVNNFSLPMKLPEAPPTVGPASFYKGDGPVNASPPASPVHWIDINKTFGPVNLQKIGLNYRSGEATFGISAGFSVANFSMAMQGLTITFPLPLPGIPAGDKVEFGLDGLAMSLKTSGFTIGGAFLKSVINDYTNYFGQVIVQVGQFGFKAIGGYAPAQKGNPASFFLYAAINAPIGGPPEFYVSGLAFGFGVNYALNLPTIETLPGYLLLPSNAPAQPGNASDAFSGVLGQLAGGSNPVVTNEPGQYWVAAGIQFGSFQMVNVFALLTFSFGVNFQVAILGVASVSLPQGAPDPIAYIEIDVMAAFIPAQGLITVAGVISPSSFVWGNFVKITGGFAFCTWFAGENKGDFVLTVGGYNTAYVSSGNKPDRYPNVPRLALSYGLGPFQATGSAYVALLPSMFQAGLKFTASFTAGPIKAWFTAGVDFMVGWAPFFYQANAYVNVGCSVNLGLFSINVSVGADLIIWGPPFGGKAEVDLDVVTFTIRFGSEQKPAAPISWTDLENGFLHPAQGSQPPAPRTMRMARRTLESKANASRRLMAAANTTNSSQVTASVGTGLIQQDVKDAEGRTWDWIVDPDKFVISTATSVPANAAQWASASRTFTPISNLVSDYDPNTEPASQRPFLQLAPGTLTYSDTEVWNPNLCVKPLGKKDVKSIHTITLLKADNTGSFTQYEVDVLTQPVISNSASALWGDPDKGNTIKTDSLVTNTLVGFNILPLPRHPSQTNDVPLIQLLFTQGNATTFSWTSSQVSTQYSVTSTLDPTTFALQIKVVGASAQNLSNQDYVLQSLDNAWVASQRNTILDDLAANGFGTYASAQVNLNRMSTTEELTDWPLVGLLGTIPAPTPVSPTH